MVLPLILVADWKLTPIWRLRSALTSTMIAWTKTCIRHVKLIDNAVQVS